MKDWPSTAYTEALTDVWRTANSTPATPVLSPPAPKFATARLRCAVIAHVFYTDLLEELSAVVSHLPPDTDVYISVLNEESAQFVRRQGPQPHAGRLDVRVVRNRGRDIAPKYVTFNDVYRTGYDAILFLHTKKSLHSTYGATWRRHMFESLAGSPKRVEQVLRYFVENPTLGIIGPEHLDENRIHTGWHGNYSYALKLAKRMGFPIARWSPPDFPSGSMFWARPAALAPIADLHLRSNEFPPESGQIARTPMHALERLVFACAEHAGFRGALIAHDVVECDAHFKIDFGLTLEASDPGIHLRLRAVPGMLRRMRFDVGLRVNRVKRYLVGRHLKEM